MFPAVVTSVDHTGNKNLRIRRVRSWETSERVVRRMVGLGTGLIYGVHAANLKNLARGLVERVFHIVRPEGLGTVPQPREGVFKRLTSIRSRLVDATCRTPVVERDDYPQLYHGRKRGIYQRAVDSLANVTVQRRDAFVNTFIKAEKVNLSAKADPAPRVIQPRTPRYNVEVGRYLKLLEKSVFGAFRKVFGYHVVLKGFNASEVAAQLRSSWDCFSRPVAVGLDASRFDQHVSRAALEWEHSVYNMVFRDANLARLLSWQLVNVGYAFVDGHRVDYQVEGKRMSGDINTGLGNCLLMSSMVIAYCEERGVKHRLANNGDDCVLIVEAADLSQLDGLDKWMLDFGFTLTREAPVRVFERIEFCQANPVYTSSGWRMVRNPLVSMSKDMVSLHGWGSEDEVRYWLHSIGSCGSSLTAGVPVLSAWYARLVELGTPGSQGWEENIGRSGMWYMARGLEADTAITAEARVSFWRAFGIDPDLQVILEDEYRCMTAGVTPSPMMLPNIAADNDNPLTLWRAIASATA